MGYDLARVTEQTQIVVEALANARREMSELQTVIGRARRAQPASQELITLAGFDRAWDGESDLRILEGEMSLVLKRWRAMQRVEA